MSLSLIYTYKKYFLSNFYFFRLNKEFDMKYNNLPIINKPSNKSISTQTSFEDFSIFINNDHDDDVDNGEIPSQSFIDAGNHLYSLSQ